MWINGFWADGFWIAGFWDGDDAPPPSGQINPLAVAVQGVGFGVFLMSVQGFSATGAPPVVDAAPRFVGFIANMGTMMGRM